MDSESGNPPAQELIILCCHTIYLGSSTSQDPSLESSWHLSSFQRGNNLKPSEHETFLLHILSSLFLLSQRPESRLAITGGRTARNIIDQSEARSYFNACEVLHQSGHPNFGKSWEEVRQRILLEEVATDSFQNLLFSILLFKKTVGNYPSRITVVSHAFKSRRFLDLHAPAIHWPKERILVEGINPPFSAVELDEVEEGERNKAYDAFVKDPYGVEEVLHQKRKSRGWDENMLHSLAEGLEASVRNLLLWKGGNSSQEIYPHDLPWTERKSSNHN